MIFIAPSVLASDFSRFGEEVSAMENAGADRLHLDVMDGHFVPNISFGPQMIASISKKTQLFFDTHLMISHPKQYAKAFVDAGSDRITFHLESEDDVTETIQEIRSHGAQVGIALRPATPASEVIPYLDQIQQVLVMTVEPGFGGQSFMEDMCPKIAELATYRKEHQLKFDIQVDGGIDETTAEKVVSHGANVLVAGSALFSQSDYTQAVDRLRAMAEKGLENLRY